MKKMRPHQMSCNLGHSFNMFLCPPCEVQLYDQNIAKGTTDPRVEFILQNIDKHQLQNFNQTSASQLNLKLKS